VGGCRAVRLCVLCLWWRGGGGCALCKRRCAAAARGVPALSWCGEVSLGGIHLIIEGRGFTLVCTLAFESLLCTILPLPISYRVNEGISLLILRDGV